MTDCICSCPTDWFGLTLNIISLFVGISLGFWGLVLSYGGRDILSKYVKYRKHFHWEIICKCTPDELLFLLVSKFTRTNKEIKKQIRGDMFMSPLLIVDKNNRDYLLKSLEDKGIVLNMTTMFRDFNPQVIKSSNELYFILSESFVKKMYGKRLVWFETFGELRYQNLPNVNPQDL